jgi:hypothetical protein
VANNDKVPVKRPLLPPEEKFWKRYSPHHEFPLSSVTSISLYILGGALVFFIGRYMMDWALDFSKPLPVDLVEIGGGSGGSPDGDNKEAGDPNAKGGEEAAANTQIAKTTPDEKPPETDLSTPSLDPLQLPEIKSQDGRLFDESNQAVQALSQIQKDARVKLFDSLKPADGKGPRGSGKGGGPGHGDGTGTGDGTGPGKGGNLNVRQRRVLRWQIDFRVRDVQDHLRQFDGLGAILAVPDPRGGYRVFRDLKHRPLVGKLEDISKINRIWFIDTLQEHPDSVSELSRALGMPPAPHIVAFFPQKLEEQMARDEERFRGVSEDKIDLREKIVFQVRPAGGGYEVVVAENQP